MTGLKRILTVFILAFWPALATAQGAENGLFQGARAIYGQALTQTGVEQATSYKNARLLLDMIVSQFPGSPLAGQIQRRETVEGLDIAALNAALGIPAPLPAPQPVAPGGEFAPYLGRWNDGGRYCAEISESNQPGLALLRIWSCSTDIANSAIAPLVPAPDGLRGAAQQVSVRLLAANELSIDLAAPLYDPFQNPIGPNGPGFSPRFVKEAAPVLPTFLAVPPPATEATEEALTLERADRREIQRRLTLLGFSTRGVDGVFGAGSRTAITEWQTSQNLPATGFLNETQVAALREQTEALYQEWRNNNRSSGSGLPAGWWRNSQGQYCRRALLGSTWCQPVRP